MMTVPVYNKAGEQVGSRDVDESIFGVEGGEPNYSLLKQAVVMYQANLRQGTFRTKNRGEVSGSTRKLYKQKGTGRARSGSVRSPVRVGGGHAHQKLPRDFRQDMPKSARRRALDHAIFAKLKAGKVVVVDDFTFAAPRTRDVARFLGKVKADVGAVTIAPAAADAVLHKSSRNIPKAEVVPVGDLNAFQVIKSRSLVLTAAALDKLVESRKSA